MYFKCNSSCIIAARALFSAYNRGVPSKLLLEYLAELYCFWVNPDSSSGSVTVSSDTFPVFSPQWENIDLHGSDRLLFYSFFFQHPVKELLE
jgi:hypothetical protein